MFLKITQFLYALCITPLLTLTSKASVLESLPKILTDHEEFSNDVTRAKTSDPRPARSYRISANQWFDSETKNFGTRDVINQLMTRYALFSKNILSIGSGDGSVEEIWFLKDGHNTVTLFDLDEGSVIEDRLKGLDTGAIEKNAIALRFFIGDFMNEANASIGTYDVVYMSGFTPHEIRRGKISQAFLTLTPEQKESIKTFEKFSGDSDVAWPSWKQPFDPKILYETQKLIQHKGLFIYQAYCSGIDAMENKGYVTNTLKQLKGVGLIPLEFYALEEAPGVQLIIAFKGTEEEAHSFYKTIKDNPRITSFHGRAALPQKTANLLYALIP